MFMELRDLCCSQLPLYIRNFSSLHPKILSLKKENKSKRCLVSGETLRRQLERKCVGGSSKCAPFKASMLLLQSWMEQLVIFEATRELGGVCFYC